MAEKQHTIGKAKTFKRTVSLEHAVAKHTFGKATHADVGVGKTRANLEAAGETLRRATEKSGSRVRRSADSFEGLEKDTLVAMMDGLQETLDLLGGDRILGSAIHTELDVHELLHRGLPRGALSKLIDNLHVIQVDEATEALGLSLRTLQRHKNTPVVPLDVQQSGRTWKFAEILAKATRVLGSQDEAEQWLERPAIGLDQQRPIDLLTTPAGVKLVEDYLGRLEYDVYT
jgi:putative toxin-antitoxin system antitoxin component (TIGR02293 family)